MSKSSTGFRVLTASASIEIESAVTTMRLAGTYTPKRCVYQTLMA